VPILAVGLYFRAASKAETDAADFANFNAFYLSKYQDFKNILNEKTNCKGHDVDWYVDVQT